MFVSADLRDHPSYGNAEHQIKLNISLKLELDRIIIQNTSDWNDSLQSA